MKHFLFFALMIAMSVGCKNTKKADLEKINAVELKLKSMPGNQRMDEKLAQEAIATYTEYADKNKADTASAGYLFLSADILRGIGKSKECLGIYERILKDYPTYSKAAQCLFLIGFTYDNDMKDLEKAKASYLEFLKKYPKHELADDVQFSIDHLGKSPDDIIKEFELMQQQKADSGKTKIQ
jgi:tetratricopeptide (TPR) repeat protein